MACRLAAPLETGLTRQTAATLLRPCPGRRSGDRVLAGAVQRGDGEIIDAVLWYSDLRGFTPLSERLPRDRLIALLNAHFERLCAACSVQRFSYCSARNAREVLQRHGCLRNSSRRELPS